MKDTIKTNIGAAVPGVAECSSTECRMPAPSCARCGRSCPPEVHAHAAQSVPMPQTSPGPRSLRTKTPNITV